MLHQKSTDATTRPGSARRVGDRTFRRSFAAVAVLLELVWILVVGYAVAHWLT